MRNVGVRPENSLCGSTWPLVPTWDICFKYQHSFFFQFTDFFFILLKYNLQCRVFVSTVQQSLSHTCMRVFFPIIVCHEILNSAP